jgi:outer membrane lipoprotein SlyB
MKVCTTMVIALLAAGCASHPPNTPGKGSGMTYTPVIDLQGVDSYRYGNDLDACRQYSASIDTGAAGVSGAVAGALLGGALAAAFGGSARSIERNASGGALIGGTRSGNRAIGKQETIIANCMASRGYRVIDGTATVSTAPMALTAPPPAPAPTAATFTTTAPAGAVATAPPPAQQAPVVLPKEVMPKPQPQAQGQDGFVAAKFAQQQKCSSFDVGASFVAKGPGFETYSVPCTNGETLIVRCEFGNCRALR